MKRWILLVALLVSAPVAAQGIDFGKMLSIGKKAGQAGHDFTEAEEIDIGKGMAAGILGVAPPVANENVQRYVNRVGRWLALQTDRPDLPWRFAVIDSTDVNAFALPGGSILISKGLYQRLRDESELAGVLAHEIAHVIRHHHIKAIKSAASKELMTAIGGEVAVRSGSRYSGIADKVFSTGMEVMVRGLDKRDEFQADHIGVVLATRAGYNPFGLVGVLQTLGAINPKEGGVALLFSTHPTPDKRIEMLSARLGEQMDRYGDSGATPARLPSLP